MEGAEVPSDQQELQAIGATAVNAAAIEQQIIKEAAHGEDTVPETAEDDTDELQEQLRAVRRELRAVRAAVDRMQQPEAEAGPSDAAPAPLAQGELQTAVMKQRLAGLVAREATLQSTLAAAGIQDVPDGPTEEALQDVLLAAQRKNSKGKGKGKPPRSAHADLQEDDLFDAAEAAAAAARGRGGGSLVETERDRLIRLGVLTPFDQLGGFERRVERGPSGAEANASIARVGEKVRAMKASRHASKLVDFSELPRPERPAKRVEEGFWRAAASKHDALPKKRRRQTLPRASRKRRARGVAAPDAGGGDSEDASESEASGSEELLDSDAYSSEEEAEALDAKGEFDDADVAEFERRQEAYTRSRRRRRLRRGTGADGDVPPEEGASEESEGEVEDVTFEGGFKVPGDLYAKLFDYQRTAVKWMWELHNQRAGGIIGDEMGLGKTVQVIAFLGGLHHSGLFRPTLIVCPATVLNQWLRELRTWYPPFRVAILHESAGRSASGARPNARAIVRQIAASSSGVLLTTYDQLRLRREELLTVSWGYAVLDEGHKIRNPDAEVTLTAKQIPTVHRIIMTGSPIQNRLTELWSLFDFVFPGKLGTLPVFQAQFAIPIQIGGYANATPLQVSAAYKCAVVLRDLISPYLLRRRKADVAAALPKKTEQVLFCTLTTEQREMYRSYLASKELGEILSGNRAALAGIDILRKVCNHPDLLERTKWEAAADYGNPQRSGKLKVLEKVLTHWKEQDHKALVFTQTQQMLDIIERLVVSHGWRYHRMDGSTSVATRARLIDDFNNNDEIFVFLLTTRVGGLGVNLTGANRCVIYDPDWNPSTDVQARERAWRIGQSREVTVYRLITSGTIEEKVYHRQVYKQFLTDRVLRDPRQKRFFKARDLSDLFTLGDEYAYGTETAEIFAGLDTAIQADADGDRAAVLSNGGASGNGESRRAPGQGALEGSPSDRDDYDSSGGGEPSQTRRRASTNVNAPDEEVAADHEGGSGSGEVNILRDLLDGTGVHAALDHSKIEGAHDPERRTAQKEAAKIAQRAAEALRQSRLQVQQAPLNQPTWTGRSGAAGAPAPRRFGAAMNARLQPAANGVSGSGGRFGAGGGGAGGALRSSDLLAQMRARQAAVANAAMAPELASAQALAERLASFLQGKGGSAPSAAIAAAFQYGVGAPDVALFKNVLKQVAQLERRPGGGKEWVLKPEFAATG